MHITTKMLLRRSFRPCHVPQLADESLPKKYISFQHVRQQEVLPSTCTS